MTPELPPRPSAEEVGSAIVTIRCRNPSLSTPIEHTLSVEVMHLERERDDLRAELTDTQAALENHRTAAARVIGVWEASRALIMQAAADIYAVDTADGGEPSESVQILRREVHRFIDATDDLVKDVKSIEFCPTGDHYVNLRELQLQVLHLRAALAAQDWQPIETAPKDGSYVLLRMDGQRLPYVGHWRDYHRDWIDGRYQTVNPTHWCPISPFSMQKEVPVEPGN